MLIFHNIERSFESFYQISYIRGKHSVPYNQHFWKVSTQYIYSTPYVYSFESKCPPNIVIPYPTSIRYSRVRTLACRISVGLRLLILRIFLHGYMLVWVATFINFEPWENGKLYRLSCECATSVNKCHYQVSWTKHCYIFLWFWFFLVSFKYVIVNILFCRYFLGYVFLILKTFYMAIIIRQTTFIKFWEVLLGYVY